VKLEVLINSTGLREDDSGFYYANRTGNKKKNSAKMTVVVDAESQVISAEDVKNVTGK